ncbi:hypothetical protein HK100_004117 [Physocladia obscura]|uniref:BZIP domain-containing protein n=1 Tax=Physocladia obscura TaxID=109957 RepID=A0AAD5ST71_9FUNG|nr:hypothetical protein HK100_004117 [Physocladia obscura]
MDAREARTYEPNNNRGRKKTLQQGQTKRVQQMRDAQRSLRARKQEYIINLENKVSRLSEENSYLKQELQRYRVLEKSELYFPINVAASFCVPIDILENGNASFQLNETATTNCDDFLNKVWVSAEELYGQIDVEPFKTRLNTLMSFSESDVINQLFQSRVNLSRATETRAARNLQIKYLRDHSNLLKKCGIMDYVNLVELETEFNTKYSRHISRFQEICANPAYKLKIDHALAKQKMTTQLIAFRNALNDIPSLDKFYDLVDNYCYFWALYGLANIGPDEFFSVGNMFSGIFNACKGFEDKKSFLFALSILRRHKLNEMVAVAVETVAAAGIVAEVLRTDIVHKWEEALAGLLVVLVQVMLVAADTAPVDTAVGVAFLAVAHIGAVDTVPVDTAAAGTVVVGTVVVGIVVVDIVVVGIVVVGIVVVGTAVVGTELAVVVQQTLLRVPTFQHKIFDQQLY